MRIPAWLDEDARRRIEEAVRQAERHTRGEIVVAVVGACDEYGSAGWRCGVLLAGLALLGLGLFAAPPLWVLAAGQALALAAGHALARVPAVRRAFVSDALLAEAAERRAATAFLQHGLQRTAGRTGILLLVALFEHRVVVLADEGVDRRVGPGESWDDVVERALGGIRDGRPVEGLVAAVRRCGEILAHPLPPLAEDRNEILHALVVEES